MDNRTHNITRQLDTLDCTSTDKDKWTGEKEKKRMDGRRREKDAYGLKRHDRKATETATEAAVMA